MNKQEVVEYVRQRIQEEEENILNEIGKKIAYWVLTAEKYDVDYTETVPYDNSGEIHKIGENLGRNSYDTLEDFLDEYTGNRRATYCSGYGWSYDTYADELQYVVNPLLYNVVEKCFQELKVTDSIIINEIAELTLGKDDEEEIYELFTDFIDSENIDALSYIEEWKELSFMDIFKRGEFVTKRQLEEELKVAKHKCSKDDEYRAIVNDLFNKYVDLCGAKIEKIAATNDKYTGHMFLKRQDVSNYLDKIVYNEIKDILNINFTKKELAILSRYKLITSNTVKAILEDRIDLYESLKE